LHIFFTVGLLFIIFLLLLVSVINILLLAFLVLFSGLILGLFRAVVFVWRNVLAFAGVVELIESSLLECLEIQVRVLNYVCWLIAEHFTGVIFEHGVEVFGKAELFTIFGSHCN
jgi:hypothetical protein